MILSQEEKWLLHEKYGGKECEAFFTDVELLQSGTPLAYLIGSIPFLGCTIYLDSHPLIPRTETEFWTEKAIDLLRKEARPNPHILDLCAGSGAIGIAVAKEIPEACVDFAEIDPAHLPSIKKNAQWNLGKHSSLLKYYIGNLFEAIPISTSYDFILTNPPYINPEIDRAEESVKLHEPSLALYGGTMGMEYIDKIIQQAPKHLAKYGQLWIEHEPEQRIAIMQQAQKFGFSASAHKDQYGIERYSILVLQ